MSETQQIAQTIQSQISLQTKLACGTRELLCNKSIEGYSYLQMRVGSSRKRLFIRVFYMPSDTYNVELISQKDKFSDTVQLQEYEDIYADQLSNIIYSMVNEK